MDKPPETSCWHCWQIWSWILRTELKRLHEPGKQTKPKKVEAA